MDYKEFQTYKIGTIFVDYHSKILEVKCSKVGTMIISDYEIEVVDCVGDRHAYNPTGCCGELSNLNLISLELAPKWVAELYGVTE